MIAFDADVLGEIGAGNPVYVARLAQIPVGEQCIPVVVIEEILRGRMSAIRRAEAKRGKTSIVQAYELLAETFKAFRQARILPYDAAAEDQFQQWRTQIRIGTHDLRIAAICVSLSVTLVTRNQRDFLQVPGLSLEVW
jgi:tRNA(fMet)-specific endonuclease VapC